MTAFRCRSCDNSLHFENSVCVSCGSRLGFSRAERAIMPVDENGRYVDASGTQWYVCRNLKLSGCTWLGLVTVGTIQSFTNFRDVVVGIWVPLSVALNMINRSMGHSDLYPFVIPRGVLEKLDFVASLARQGSPPPDGPLRPVRARSRPAPGHRRARPRR